MPDDSRAHLTSADAGSDGASLLDGMRNGSWLDEQLFPPLRYVVDGIIPEGLTLLAGPPKVGKSWLILHIALSVAAGNHVLGCLPVGAARPVLYLALEDSWRRLQYRCRSLLGEGRSIPSDLHLLVDIAPNLVVAAIVEWLGMHEGKAPLVIVDTLGKVTAPARPGESAYQADYRNVGNLKSAADKFPGTSLVLVHHIRKAPSADFLDAVSGTNGVAGAADTAVLLSRTRTESDGVLKVTGRDVDESEYAVSRSSNGLWQLKGGTLDAARSNAVTEKATTGLGERSAEVVKIVADSPDGIGPTALGKKLGVTASQAGTYLTRLAEQGRIEQRGRGRYVSVSADVIEFPQFPHFPQGSGDDDDD